jgi:DNA anti-recombination protein RmuC
MLLASVVRVLDDVVGQAAGQAVTDALARLEQSHARDLAALAERFEAALERQEARSRELLERQDERLRELLERQDERLREVLASQARAHADELRAVLREVASERSEHPVGATFEGAPSPEAWQEIQETLRLGFGEVRSALDRNNHELTKVQAKRAPLAPIAASA